MKRKTARLLLGIYFVLSLSGVVFASSYLSRLSFEAHFLDIMKNLNSNDVKTTLRNMFDRNYNFTELFKWEHERTKFVPIGKTFNRSTDPLRILEIGKGRCEEFSILYVALSLAHGYQSRLVAAAGVYFWDSPHVWAETRLDGRWFHVDPSDSLWNKPLRYVEWPWGQEIGSGIRIYAFEDGRCIDVTQSYVAEQGT